MSLWQVRDWFLIQLRRGITKNDQDPLFAAEVRQARAGGLRVGQVPTEYATAFYSPGRSFFPRITRMLHGPVRIIHADPKIQRSWCESFNKRDVNTPRQMVASESIRQASSLPA